MTRRSSSPVLAALAVVLALALPSRVSAGSISVSLAEANGFNLLTWGNASLTNSDTEGAVAVGGNASFSGYSIGTKLPAGNPAQAAFVVGGDLTAAHGQVSNGSIYVGGSMTGPGYALNSAPGSTTTANLGTSLPFDFAAAEAALSARSLLYGATAANGSSVLQWSTLTLTGNDAELNIFNITASMLADASSLVVNATAGSRVLINVSGDAASFSNKGLHGNLTAANTLFNFYEADQLSLTGIGVIGSILAPFADVNFTSGQMNGQLIAKSFAGASWGVGELHYHPFNSAPPPSSVPDAGATAGLLVGALVVLGAFVRTRR